MEPPYNRWSFLHVREFAATARISRGSGPVLELPRAEPQPDILSFEYETMHRHTTIGEMLEASYTDGLLVLRDGVILAEHYMNGMRPDDTHLLMSVSKSLTSTCLGALVGEGLIDTTAPVTSVIPALRRTSWEGCTIQHLLDMRAGTLFDEADYDDPESDGRLIEEVSGYRPRVHDGLPADTCDWISKSKNAREHGGPFEYRSLLTDVLAWAVQEASGPGARFADVFAEKIWSRIGAEHDGDVIVDSSGFPAAEGGMCVTLRDLARFGILCMEDGQIQGARVVPQEWFRRIYARDQGLIDVFAASDSYDPAFPDECYHNQWWVLDPGRELYSGFGINGQQLLIHRPSRTVIAKFSTQPRGHDDEMIVIQNDGLIALAAGLSPRKV